MEVQKCSFVFGSEAWKDCESVTILFKHSDLKTYGNFYHSLIGLDNLIDFIRESNDFINDVNEKQSLLKLVFHEVNQKHIDVVIERLESLKKLNPNLLVDLES